MNLPPNDPGEPSSQTAKKPRTLPFSNWAPLAAGAIVGIALRLIFSGDLDRAMSAMDAAFIYLTPLAVGAVTVYVAESKQRRGWRYYVMAPMLSNALFVAGTMAIFIEGLICAIVILPLFCVLGAVGGLLMGAICRATKWRKGAVYSFGALPLLAGVVPQPHEAGAQDIHVIERSIAIAAPPERIWQQIHDARDIQPDEVGQAWMYRIGVPLPIAGITQHTPSGIVRKVTMGKSIHFDQIGHDWQENRHVRWTYRFDADSFPAGALDDHVRIGGRYFDLIDTSYTLTPQTAQITDLNIQMHYRVSTQFNWYAGTVATLLIGNFEDVILGFYRHRAERSQTHASASNGQ